MDNSSDLEPVSNAVNRIFFQTGIVTGTIVQSRWLAAWLVRSPPDRAVLDRALALVDCAEKKAYYAFSSAHIFLEIMPKLCYFLKIMLSVTEIMLLTFYRIITIIEACSSKWVGQIL